MTLNKNQMEAIEYDKLPEDVKAILNTYNDDCINIYDECRRIQSELNKIGWDCDYDLSGDIFDVKPKV